MKKILTLSLLVGSLLFTACSTKIISIDKVQDHIVSKENSVVEISSPKLNYKGLVTIIKLDNGNIALKPSHSNFKQIDILKDKICVVKKHTTGLNEPIRECLPKQEVVNQSLSVDYPKDTLNNVLNGQPIFDKVSARETTDGLRQAVLDKNADILYRVFPNETYFEDRANAVKIVIKR